MNNEDVDSGGGDVGVKKPGIENELDLIGSENLDVTDFINMRFPTEESLDNDLESFLENLKEGLSFYLKFKNVPHPRIWMWSAAKV